MGFDDHFNPCSSLWKKFVKYGQRWKSKGSIDRVCGITGEEVDGVPTIFAVYDEAFKRWIELWTSIPEV